MIMQTIDEQIELGKHVMATAEVIGTVLSSTAARMIVEDLEQFSFLDCAAALKKCRAEVRGRLTLSDVVNRINSNDGRPTKDEAWGIAMQSADERDTVIWTPEICAAYDAAKTILRSGEKVGARMAFMSAYERLLVAARASGEPAKWIPSVGWDGQLRARAFEMAVKLERISAPEAVAMLQLCGHGSPECAELVRALLPPDGDKSLLLGGAMTADGRAIAGLLTGASHNGMLALTSDSATRAALLTEDTSASREASPEVSSRLQQLKADMIKSSKEKEQRRVQLLEAQRRDFNQRKEKVQQQVDEALKKDAQQ